MELENKAIYHAMRAYIKYDYFERKSFVSSPTYNEVLVDAEKNGLTTHISDELYELLRVQRPKVL
jgi:hypothetical protein